MPPSSVQRAEEVGRINITPWQDAMKPGALDTVTTSATGLESARTDVAPVRPAENAHLLDSHGMITVSCSPCFPINTTLISSDG